MEDDKSRTTGPRSKNIEKILRERARLDKVIEEKFRKKMAVLFSDVCGYTHYVDTRGDISGRAWLQKHHDIVLPLIEEHGGTIIDMIGDGVLASFSTTLSAVKASIAIQENLQEYNLKTETSERIHVKIGINTGQILVDEGHIAGDVVNVGSRIQSQAGPDQILLSKSAYEEVCGSEDILCRFYRAARVKGKPEPLELFKVVWRDDDIVVSDTKPKVRSLEDMPAREIKQPLKVLYLEVAREGNRIKISSHEQTAGETSTIRHYEEIKVSMDRIESRSSEMLETLNKANRRNRVSREALTKLREIGQAFSDELFTVNIKEKLRKTKAQHLSLHLDDRLVHVPWELLHDGQQFLCQRFNMGRLVRTRQPVPASRSRILARPVRMLILADPRGDLKGAYQEGIDIRDYMDRDKDLVNVSLRSDNITPNFIKEKIRNFDLVHYAGHADYNRLDAEQSGWRLTTGSFKAQDIIKMAGTAVMPALIFSNACQSGRTEEWKVKEYFQSEIFGLANAFVLAGVRHYVGTFWEILDEPSSHFALEFYKNLLSGMTIGEAIRESRVALIREFGEESIVWASYILYGDPTSNYIDQIKKAREEEEPEAPVVTASRRPSEMEVRAQEEIVDFAKTEVKAKKRAWLAILAAVVALAFVLLWGYPGFLKKDTAKYERAALAYYNEGNFEKAFSACKSLEDKNPQVRLSYLIQGDIHLRRGKLDAAQEAYQKALKATDGTGFQKAKAFVGLGRIASICKQTDKALNYYRDATEAAPESGLGYLPQALLLEERGDYDEALDRLTRVQKLVPKDKVLAAVTNETKKKVAIARDQQKQDRINQMVKELLDSMKLPPRALPRDGWTSLPLTMWLMDFRTQGYSLQEGEERLLASGIADQLLQQSRIRLVERALLDKLLEELKLGVSKLVDPRAQLSLGKLLAARLIVSGQVVYSGAQTQVSIRLIETETGRISAAVNESFKSATSITALTEKLSGILLEKLKKAYPLRSKIAGVAGEDVRLNIGQEAGVEVGQQFKVIDKDVILEVIAVQAQMSLCKIVKGQGPILEGLRAEAYSEKLK